MLRATLQTFVSQAFELEFANLFRDMSFEELDEAAKSFRFDKCLQREGLNKIMSEHAEISKSTLAEGRPLQIPEAVNGPGTEDLGVQ